MTMRGIAILVLLAVMAIVSTLSIFTSNMHDLGFGSLDIAFIRLFVATAVLLAIILLVCRDSLRIGKRDVFFLILFGVFRYLMDYTFYLSLEVTSVSLATLLQNTAPYFVAVISYFIFKQRVSKMALASIIMGSFGCVLMSGKALLGADFEPVGIMYALISAFSLAMFIIGSDRGQERGYGAVTYLCYVLLVATIVSVPFADLGMIASRALEADVLINSLVLGIVMTLLQFYVMAWGVKYLDSTTVAVICVLEVVFAALVGAFYFAENLDYLDAIGIALMVGSLVLISKNEADGGKEKQEGDGTSV